MRRSRIRSYSLGVSLRFVTLFSLGALAVLVALGALETQRLDAQRQQDRVRLALTAATLGRDLRDIIATLRIVHNSDQLRRYVDNPTPAAHDQLAQLFKSLAQHDRHYDQIRVLGVNGRERLRVDYAGGRAITVPAADLQSKAHRYYFRDAITMAQGEVYVSPLDLNVEHGVVERPLKPTIRVATPLFDGQGHRRGVLVLNYLAQGILDQFKQGMQGSSGNVMLLNRDGYWLYSGTPAEQWGFQLPHGASFAKRYPDAWRHIRAANHGDLLMGGRHFLFETVHLTELVRTIPDIDVKYAGGDDNYWKLVSLEPVVGPIAVTTAVMQRRSTAAGLLLTAAALASLLVAVLRTNNLRQAAALRESEERFGLAMRGANEALFDWEVDRDRVFFSTRWKAMLGHRDNEIGETMDEWTSRLHPDDKEQVLAAMDDHLAGRTDHYDHVCRLRHKSGRYIWVQCRGQAVRDARGRALRMVGTCHDITERTRTEERLRQAAAVFDNTSEAIVITDREQRIMATNRAFTEITGYRSDEVQDKPIELLRSERDSESFYRRMNDALLETGQWRGETWNRRRNGEIFPAWQNVSAVRDERGAVKYLVWLLTDISELKNTELKLQELAHHDVLTGLPNRLLFNAHLERALERAKRHNQRTALLFLDLDRFKVINDTLGHAAGDRLLEAVASRLRESVRAEDTVARLGGDEFTVIVEEVRQAEDIAPLAHKILDTISQPLSVDGHEISTSASIGIGIYPDHAATGRDLIKAADVAMYHAKAQGRSAFRYYTPDLSAKAYERLLLEQGLQQALPQEQLALLYQPQISLATNEVVGVEALVRWNHPDLGLIMPDRFIGVAEETGLIVPLGEWVLRQAWEQAREWVRNGMILQRIAVNVSARQVLDPGFTSAVQEIVGNVRPGAIPGLDLEITETSLQTVRDAVNTLRFLKTLGIRLAIDDFGTGYSSLSALKDLPVDMLKIDRSFIRDAPGSADAEAIVAAIVAMGHQLNLRVLAEGVETDAQKAFLRELHCDEMQGFLFSPPVTAAEMIELGAAPANGENTDKRSISGLRS